MKEEVEKLRNEIAVALTIETGRVWTRQKDRDGDTSRFMTDGHYTLSVSWQGYNNQSRVEIGGCFWKGTNNLWSFVPRYDEKITRSITCAVSRGLEAIAKDINNRLLAEFCPAFDRALLAWEAEETRKRNLTEKTMRLAAIVGGRKGVHCSCDYVNEVHFGDYHVRPCGVMKSSNFSGDGFHTNLSIDYLTEEQTEEILKLVATFFQSRDKAKEGRKLA